MDFSNPEIEQVYTALKPQIKDKLLTIRTWVFELVASSPEIGQIEECLKWGEPSYLTSSPKSGTTLRLSGLKKSPSEYGLFVHCQTGLVEEFRVAYPELKYDKNRGLILDSNQPIPADAVKQFIYLALTYHSRKKRA